MAKLPTQRRVSKEDFPDAPSWFDNFTAIISSFMREVYSALNGNLTFGENVNGMVKKFRITAGAAPENNTFTFTHELKLKPFGVYPCQVTQVTGSYAPITSAVFVSWRLNDGGQIVIDAITGLTNGSIYDITVLVI